MDDNNTLEALAKSLNLEMASPFSIFLHAFYVFIKLTIFVLIQKRLKEIFVLHHVSTCFFSHELMSLFTTINLVCKRSKQTVSIPYNISDLDSQDCNLFIKLIYIVNIIFGEFEPISFTHFLSEFFLNFHVFFTVLFAFFDFFTSVFFSAHLIL